MSAIGPGWQRDYGFHREWKQYSGCWGTGYCDFDADAAAVAADTAHSDYAREVGSAEAAGAGGGYKRDKTGESSETVGVDKIDLEDRTYKLVGSSAAGAGAEGAGSGSVDTDSLA